jgi:hypothetical protein
MDAVRLLLVIASIGAALGLAAIEMAARRFSHLLKRNFQCEQSAPAGAAGNCSARPGTIHARYRVSGCMLSRLRTRCASSVTPRISALSLGMRPQPGQQARRVRRLLDTDFLARDPDAGGAHGLGQTEAASGKSSRAGL